MVVLPCTLSLGNTTGVRDQNLLTACTYCRLRGLFFFFVVSGGGGENDSRGFGGVLQRDFIGRMMRVTGTTGALFVHKSRAPA